MPTLMEDPALLAPVAVRQQLTRLCAAEHLRHSRRSMTFLRYIVEETLLGRADELKERTIGVSVFGKPLTYDTNDDHVVRTAASELRRRLALYYAEEQHRDELRIVLLPGSYVPQFRLSEPAREPEATPLPSLPEAPASIASPTEEARVSPVPQPAPVAAAEPHHRPGSSAASRFARRWVAGLVAALVVTAAIVLLLMRPAATPQQRLWQPLLRSRGPVLIAVGDVPQGPPVPASDGSGPPAPSAGKSSGSSVPFGDATAIARVAAVLAASGKEFAIRREDASSFADLRQGPVVLVGAFNNVWSLQLSRDLRFSLAMDPAAGVIYIRDREHPESRAWSWSTAPHPEEHQRTGNGTLHDYALISRVLDAETGHEMLMLGGLYTYGTAAAGEFIANPQLGALPAAVQLGPNQRRVQIVLETQVTDGTAGPPRVVATSVE